MVTLPFTRTTLSEISGERTFSRGAGYFAERRVSGVEIYPNRARARVEGERTYRVELRWSGSGQELQGTCTCPVGDSFCKHQVALALTCLAPEAELSKSESPFAATLGQLKGLDPEQVVRALSTILEPDSFLVRQLALVAGARTAAGCETLEKQLLVWLDQVSQEEETGYDDEDEGYEEESYGQNEPLDLAEQDVSGAVAIVRVIEALFKQKHPCAVSVYERLALEVQRRFGDTDASALFRLREQLRWVQSCHGPQDGVLSETGYLLAKSEWLQNAGTVELLRTQLPGMTRAQVNDLYESTCSMLEALWVRVPEDTPSPWWIPSNIDESHSYLGGRYSDLNAREDGLVLLECTLFPEDPLRALVARERVPECERKYVRLIQTALELSAYAPARQWLDRGLAQYPRSESLFQCAQNLAALGRFESFSNLCLQRYSSEAPTSDSFLRLYRHLVSDPSAQPQVLLALTVLETALAPSLAGLALRTKKRRAEAVRAGLDLQRVYLQIGQGLKAWQLYQQGVVPGFRGLWNLALLRCETHVTEGFDLLHTLILQDMDACGSGPAHKYAPQKTLLMEFHEVAKAQGQEPRWVELKETLREAYRNRRSFIKVLDSVG